MVGNKLNILPRVDRPLARLKRILLVYGFVLLALMSTERLWAQNLVNSGQINNTGTIRVKNQAVGLPSVVDGRFEYFGSDQTVTPVQYKVLVLSGSGTKASPSGNFVVTDSINLGSGVVFHVDSSSVLSLGGYLDERGYFLGRIRKSVDLSGGTTASAFGNIGTTISWNGTAPGVTTITRSSGVALLGNGHQSINRYYDINPATNTGLDASLAFEYRNNELNGHDSTKLQLWKSTDGGTTWLYVDAVVDPNTRTITRSNIDAFSLWTAADTATYPLGLVQTYARIIVRHYIDNDGNLNTSSDRLAKPWSITVHSDSATGPIVGSVVSDSILEVRSNTGGTFYIVEDDSSGWTRLGYQRDIGAPILSTTNTITLTAFPPQTTLLRFYSFKNGSIAGMKFNDLNADSIKSVGDNGIASWKILLAKNGLPFDSMLTLGDGSYQFNNLGYGTYTVSEHQVSGWKQTYPKTSSTYSLVMQSGQNYTAKDFGNYRYGSIAGTMFEDIDGNGANDGSDVPLVGWIVRLVESGIQVDSTLTAGDGTYSFSSLLPGTYTVREALPSGWLQTLPIGGTYTNLVISSDVHQTGKDFGNYRSGVLAGTVYYDRNANGIKDIDENGIEGWTVTATAGTPLNSQSTTTLLGGSYTFASLRPDNYTLSLTLKPNWVQSSTPGNYVMHITSGLTLTGKDFGVASPQDTFKFTTFPVDSLIVAKPVSKLKCTGFTFAFDFKNKTGRTANGIHVEFNNVVTNFTILTPFTNAEDLGRNAQAYNLRDGVVDTGQTIRVEGYSKVTPCKIKIGKWWWLVNDTNISKRKSEGPLATASIQKQIALPNPANVRDETFKRGFALSGGLRVGIIRKDQARAFGWVRIGKGLDMSKSLYDKFIMQTGTPRGFNLFSNRGRFVGEQKVLSPTKYNNRLFAELVALKFNLEASLRGITPVGLGELVYDDGTNPLSGMLVKNIALKADTMMTYWSNVASADYYNMDSTVRKINMAFSGGIDTLSYMTLLSLKGVKSISSVSYLRLPADITPIIKQQQDIFANRNEVPEGYVLYQNYPNPFNPVTTIQLSLPYSSEVTLKIYNVLGQEVTTLIDKEILDEGMQQVDFSAEEFPSGVYFYKVVAKQITEEGEAGMVFTDTKKMMYIR